MKPGLPDPGTGWLGGVGCRRSAGTDGVVREHRSRPATCAASSVRSATPRFGADVGQACLHRVRLMNSAFANCGLPAPMVAAMALTRAAQTGAADRCSVLGAGVGNERSDLMLRRSWHEPETDSPRSAPVDGAADVGVRLHGGRVAAEGDG